MKSKTSNIILVITTILLFLLVTAYGVIDSWRKSKSITEGYKASITLNETVVFDDPHIVKQYGGPVTLEVGTVGEIYEIIDWYTEKHEYKHIQARFDLEEGESFKVILDYEAENEKDTRVIIDKYDANINVLDDGKDRGNTNTFEAATPVLNINKINDSQKIASEFKQIRERYYQRVKQTIKDGSIKGVIVAFALVAVIWVVKLTVRKEKVGKALAILTICIDVAMALIDVVAFLLTRAM